VSVFQSGLLCAKGGGSAGLKKAFRVEQEYLLLLAVSVQPDLSEYLFFTLPT